jgi:hypothetical protein
MNHLIYRALHVKITVPFMDSGISNEKNIVIIVFFYFLFKFNQKPLDKTIRAKLLETRNYISIK